VRGSFSCFPLPCAVRDELANAVRARLHCALVASAGGFRLRHEKPSDEALKTGPDETIAGGEAPSPPVLYADHIGSHLRE